MSGPRLYNYYAHEVPEEILILLDLLGFWTVWSTVDKEHRIYERTFNGERPRMKWKVQGFKGGTTKEWQAFLSSITRQEDLL